MAAPHDETLREMECLLGAMTEGKLDEAGRRRLSELVREAPQARRLYLDYCQMHALLRSAHGVLCALEPEGGRRWRRMAWTVAGLLTLAASVAVLAVYARYGTPTPAASIITSRGEVRVLRDKNFSPAQSGSKVRPGERIQTGADGHAEVGFADGTSIRVGSETDACFVSPADAQRVDLKAGVLSCEVTPQPKDEPFIIATSHAELTVLGTVFQLSATPAETSVQVSRGRVRLAAAEGSVEVGEGDLATADARGVRAWKPICNLDFSMLKSMPPQLQTVFCDTDSLHTPARKIVPGPNGVCLESGGLRFVDARPAFGEHGLIVSRWTEEIGGDVAIEVGVSAGAKWSLGIAVDGDSFQGYRIIFVAPKYPNGIAIDSLYPSGQTLLAQDPRQIPYERDHTLRVEKQGQRIRVWVDRELRIDTEVAYPLAKDRKKTFAISNFGEPPLIRSLRVWRGGGS